MADHAARLNHVVSQHAEWFCLLSLDQRQMSIHRREISVTQAVDKLLLSIVCDLGTICWQVLEWRLTNMKLVFVVELQGEQAARVVELVPRTTTDNGLSLIRAARRNRCDQLAQIARAISTGLKIQRAGLSPGIRKGVPGALARILLRRNDGAGIGVIASVVEPGAVPADTLMSHAVLWYLRLRMTVSGELVRHLWIVADAVTSDAVQGRVALLRRDLAAGIELFTISADWTSLTRAPRLQRSELWELPVRKLRLPATRQPSDSAEWIKSFAPHAIDSVTSRKGETLRYHGLPFARTRRFIQHECVWFGTDASARNLLCDSSAGEFTRLVQDLVTHRAANQCTQRHAHYRMAPEAWLESLLRRNIQQLDPGLRLAPLYVQFRALDNTKGSRPIDLLALRRDGRLAVIELKTSADRDHLMQGIDYWLRVEQQRRVGAIAALFPGEYVADAPPLTYLVAPMLSFHVALATLASAVAHDIEIYRFDLNEDWRAGVRVMRRERIN